MPAQVLAKITPARDARAWREARRCSDGLYRIGSSDAPVIVYGEMFGRSLIDLWMEKRGMQEGPEENYDMRQGHLLEEVCAREWSIMTGRRVYRRHAILHHPDHPWMTANLDRVISHGDDGQGPGILEAKSPRYGTMVEVVNNGPSKAHLIQVLHQLAVTGWRWAVLAYYHRDWGVRAFPVARKGNQDIITEIIRRERLFWEALQAGELPPEPEPAPEVVIPAPYRDATAWREDALWRPAMERLGHAHAAREAAKAALAQAEEEYQAAADDVKSLLGDIQEAQTPWGSVSWKWSKPRLSLDQKRLKAELAALAEKLSKLAPFVDQEHQAELEELSTRVRGALDNNRNPGAPSRAFLAKF
jgi:putative phage-type endonuclease